MASVDNSSRGSVPLLTRTGLEIQVLFNELEGFAFSVKYCVSVSTENDWTELKILLQYIPRNMHMVFALLWLYIDWFSHIHQAFFTGTVAIERLPKCQQSNPDEYGEILHVNSLWTIAQQQQSKAQQNRVHISWDILYNPTGDCSRGSQQRQKCSHGRVVVVVYFYSAYRFEAWIINLSSFRWLNISIYVYTCIYIYIYMGGGGGGGELITHGGVYMRQWTDAWIHHLNQNWLIVKSNLKNKGYWNLNNCMILNCRAMWKISILYRLVNYKIKSMNIY